jgi:predicted ATPase/DNA-binding XRE family transcriptional regulator
VADDDAPGFAKLLRLHRQSRGLTQEGLAERATLSARAISDLERGLKQAPHATTVNLLTRALDLDPDEASAFAAAGTPRRSGSPAVRERLHVPLSLTSFVGREQNAATLVRLLETTRLLTLTGPGGIGKTRLALHVASQLGTSFAHGVWLVDLAGLVDPELVPGAVATALELREEPMRPIIHVVEEWLRPREQLLVLDNCEQVIGACAELANYLLQRCPRLRIIATSRAALGIGGETRWPVPPLSLPDAKHCSSLAHLARFEAVRLFMDRALEAVPTFSVTDDSAVAVADVCVRLDGIPLAIELAAARVRVLSTTELAQRLDNRLQLLTGGSRTAAARQQTLRSTIDWSYALLSDSERVLFARLAVFAGGWTAEAAETVCAGSGLDSHEIFDLVARLVDQSIVQTEPGGESPMRFRLLETLREYAAEKLGESGDEALLRTRHLEWAVALAEHAERELWRSDQLTWLRRLRTEQGNLRAAHAWSLLQPEACQAGLRLAGALARYWDICGELAEGSSWLSRILALPDARAPSMGRARALGARGYLAVVCGDSELAHGCLEESRLLWQSAGETRGVAACLFFLGVLAGWTDPGNERAAVLLSEGLALARQCGPRWTAYSCLICLGEIARAKGQLDGAETLLVESRLLAQANGDRWGGSYAALALGLVAQSRGDLRRAQECFRESLLQALQLEHSLGVSYALDGLGSVAAAQAQPERAARLFGAAKALRLPIGDFMAASFRIDLERGIAAAAVQLDAAVFAAAWSEGEAMSRPQAAAYAVGDTDIGQIPSGVERRRTQKR